MSLVWRESRLHVTFRIPTWSHLRQQCSHLLLFLFGCCENQINKIFAGFISFPPSEQLQEKKTPFISFPLTNALTFSFPLPLYTSLPPFRLNFLLHLPLLSLSSGSFGPGVNRLSGLCGAQEQQPAISSTPPPHLCDCVCVRPSNASTLRLINMNSHTHTVQTPTHSSTHKHTHS